MWKWLLIAAFVVCGLLLAIGSCVFAVYSASQQVPEFYEEALKRDPVAEQKASDKMLQQATALASDVEKEGPWTAVFTAEQINGWLAVDMLQNHPDLLPPSVRDPRVGIEPERLRVACRFERGDWSSVLSLAVDAYLAEPNVIALRIREARAGLVPLPLDGILKHISKSADQMDLRIQWRQAEGDPVVLITIPPPRDEDDKLVRIEALRLGEGEIYVSGRTAEQGSE